MTGAAQRPPPYSAAIRGGSTIPTAACKSTDSSRDTPRSCIVTPYSRSIRAIVNGWCVTTKNRVPVSRTISSSKLQNRSTFASSSGASTSSSTEIGAGLQRNTAKISDKDVYKRQPSTPTARNW